MFTKFHWISQPSVWLPLYTEWFRVLKNFHMLHCADVRSVSDVSNVYYASSFTVCHINTDLIREL
jgi:hypothetical protein